MDSKQTGHLTIENLDALKAWFIRFVRSFYSAESIVQQAIVLKEDHSHRVREEILHIGGKLGLDDNELRIAEAMGLLHDIGRFEQYARYRTFVDAKSEDHGKLGVKVLHRDNTLADLDKTARDLILRAISYHNRLSIPEGESPVCLFFSRLLRDADKVDIFNVVSTYYYVEDAERSAAVELDLPDTPDFSEDVLDSLRKGQMIRMQQLRSLNDFKLLQLAWVYDINFAPTLQTIDHRGYLAKIRGALPPSDAIDRAYAGLMDYLRKRSKNPEQYPGGKEEAA